MSHRLQTIRQAIIFLISMVASASAHPFHVSFAEVDWNPDSGVLEVAIKMDPNDLERAVREHCKKRIDIDSSDAELRIADYVRQNFTIRPAISKVVDKAIGKKQRSETRASDDLRRAHENPELRWVGREIDTSSAWLYFEIVTKKSPDGMEIKNTLLANTERPSNTVLVRFNKRSTTMTFNHVATKRIIRFENNSASLDPKENESDR